MDVNCPYCREGQDINHDDGYGYDGDRLHEQRCSNCNKYFTFLTSISYNYEVRKADCLNGSPHEFKQTTTYPIKHTMMECVTCEKTRKPTEEEMVKILKNKWM